MQYKNIIRILGLLVGLLSVTMLPPALISLIYRDGGGLPFILAFLWCICTGFLAWYPNRLEKTELKAREGFLIVVLFWFVLASFSAIPLMLLEQPNLSTADAFFESFSGLTTTGAKFLINFMNWRKEVFWNARHFRWLVGWGLLLAFIHLFEPTRLKRNSFGVLFLIKKK